VVLKTKNSCLGGIRTCDLDVRSERARFTPPGFWNRQTNLRYSSGNIIPFFKEDGVMAVVAW
jgi:hypothetical protein